VCDQTIFLGDEEGAIQDVQSSQSDGVQGFLTILGNILTV
jgi:hypothetical protein